MVWPTLGSRTAKEQNRTVKLFESKGDVRPTTKAENEPYIRTQPHTAHRTAVTTWDRIIMVASCNVNGSERAHRYVRPSCE